MNDYDEKIAFLGQWGRSQQVVFFLLFVSTIANGTGVISFVFLAAIPDHHCKIPEVNLTQDWLSVIIPVKVVNGKQEQSSCSRYKLDVVRNFSAQGLVPGRDVNLTELEQESCVDGWTYSKDIYQSTIVSEFDLVCGEQWKQPFTSTVFFLGVLVGSFFSGQLSDRYGRKPVFFSTTAVQTIFTLLQIFSPSWIVFSVLFFFAGLGQIGNYVTAFVLGAETLTGNVRILFSSLGSCLGFCIGYMILPLLAYFLRDWKSLLLAISLPTVIYIPFWWFIPESPRWLVSQGRVEEAEAIVRNAAKKNKVEAPPVIFKDCSVEEKKCENEEHLSIFVLTGSRMRTTTLILCCVWFTVVTGYFGLSLNSAQLSTDPYIGCFISGAVEVPAYTCGWLALQYLPRRLSAIGTMLLGGASLFFIQLVPQTLPEVSFTLEMLGKYGLTTASTLLYTYTSEIYPTGIRSSAIGTCATVSRVGTCIAPFLFQLSHYSKNLPYITLGTLAVLCALATLLLPETFRRSLPETIEEMPKRQRITCPCVSREDDLKPAPYLESRL